MRVITYFTAFLAMPLAMLNAAESFSDAQMPLESKSRGVKRTLPSAYEAPIREAMTSEQILEPQYMLKAYNEENEKPEDFYLYLCLKLGMDHPPSQTPGRLTAEEMERDRDAINKKIAVATEQIFAKVQAGEQQYAPLLAHLVEKRIVYGLDYNFSPGLCEYALRWATDHDNSDILKGLWNVPGFRDRMYEFVQPYLAKMQEAMKTGAILDRKISRVLFTSIPRILQIDGKDIAVLNREYSNNYVKFRAQQNEQY